MRIQEFPTVVDEVEEVLLLVLEEDKQVIASAGLRMGERQACINRLFVRPELRRCGIATWLINHASSYAKKQGKFSIALMVEGDNEPAIACYRKAGFVWGWEYEDKSILAVKEL